MSTAIYEAPDKPCEGVDYDSLSAVLGPVSQVMPSRTSRDGRVTTSMCRPVFGKPGARVPVTIEIQIIDEGGSTADFYTGMRSVPSAPLSDVPGLGQAAYTYTDAIAGPHLATFDGNLYLTVVVLTGAPPTGIDQAMIACARAIMAKLRRVQHPIVAPVKGPQRRHRTEVRLPLSAALRPFSSSVQNTEVTGQEGPQ